MISQCLDLTNNILVYTVHAHVTVFKNNSLFRTQEDAGLDRRKNREMVGVWVQMYILDAIRLVSRVSFYLPPTPRKTPLHALETRRKCSIDARVSNTAEQQQLGLNWVFHLNPSATSPR